MNERILIVEDEPALRETLAACFVRRDYEVECIADGQRGFDAAAGGSFNLIVLDIMLPSLDGLELCRKLRRQGIRAPVLMLTARGSTKDKVMALREGADDYLTKPFEMEELLARVAALLRRASLSKDSYEIDGLQIDLKNSRIIRAGTIKDLSEREAQLLRYFLEHPGEILSREKLLQVVWGYKFAPLSRTVDVHVAWLRQKLEADPRQPRLITTVHGQGYLFTQT